MHRLGGPPPARFIEKVHDHVNQEPDSLAEFSFQILVRRGFKRPINEHGPPNHIFLRNKSPIPAVETYVAVVPHAEITVRRNHQIVSLNMLRQGELPIRSHIAHLRGRHRGEVIAVRIVTYLAALMNHVGLIQLFPVAVDHGVAQMNAVSRNADDSLDHIQPRFRRREKYDDVTAVYLPVGQNGTKPPRPWRELLAVHKYVITDQQSVLHGTRWNLERLHDERNNKQTGYQHGCK